MWRIFEAWDLLQMLLSDGNLLDAMMLPMTETTAIHSSVWEGVQSRYESRNHFYYHEAAMSPDDRCPSLACLPCFIPLLIVFTPVCGGKARSEVSMF